MKNKTRRYAENRSVENSVIKQMPIRKDKTTTQSLTAWRKKQQISV